MSAAVSQLAKLVSSNESEVLSAWMGKLRNMGGDGGGRIREAELQSQCKHVLAEFKNVLVSGDLSNIQSQSFAGAREALAGISRSRALQGFTPRETAVFTFSLKEPIFELIQKEYAKDAAKAVSGLWTLSVLVDQLGLYTMDVFQKTREEIIVRQQQEIAELSTPVVKLWDEIVALPLIGTLDSSRTQVVMENLLQAIVDQQAAIAIIDITGVPTVDTLVAQHLLKTIAAARLMGADCIISGIRPQIAQTMVHLGVELDVVSKASLADAFALALKRTGRGAIAAAKPGN
jgi:rsbT co-antagonist protein RsbR